MLDMHTQALGLPPLLWDAQPLPRQTADADEVPALFDASATTLAETEPRWRRIAEAARAPMTI